jgi:hypothetical protein
MAGAPWRLIPYKDGMISIDVDGGITIDDVTTYPFPVEISDAVISSNRLIVTWVDYDLRLARMACLPLDSPLTPGCSKGELRKEPASKMVAGAEWCHSINAEPLAMDGDDEIIVFALWEKGIYAIQPDATEVWRIHMINDPETEKLPRANEIIAIHVMEEVHVWTRSGLHIILDRNSGKEIARHRLPVEANIEQVFASKAGFLISSKKGWVWSSDGEVIIIAQKLRGTVQDAIHDGENWRIISWCEDIILGQPGKKKDELGVQLINSDDGWMVIDNQGEITPHMA